MATRDAQVHVFQEHIGNLSTLLLGMDTAGTGWAHIQHNKRRSIAHFMGYTARDWSIAKQLEDLQASELIPFLWDGTLEIIVTEQQGGQLGQCPNFTL